MSDTDTVKRMLLSLEQKINEFLKATPYRLTFCQQDIKKENMSLILEPQTGRNRQRLYIKPATKYGQYEVALSGKTLESRIREFEHIFKKECAGYSHPDSKCPYWYVDDADLVREAVYLYVRPFFKLD